MSHVKKGDAVRLKSGGPAMSVDNIGAHQFTDVPGWNAHCAWFDGNKPMQQWFDVDILVVLKDEVDPANTN